MSWLIICILFIFDKDYKEKMVGQIRRGEIDTLREKKDFINDLQCPMFGKKSSPLAKLLLHPASNFLLSAILLCGGFFALMIFCISLNKIFPNVFFNIRNIQSSPLRVWLDFLFREILNVIPIKLLSPFLTETTLVEVLRPWGKLCTIFVQTSILGALYMAGFSLYTEYKSKTTQHPSKRESINSAEN